MKQDKTIMNECVRTYKRIMALNSDPRVINIWNVGVHVRLEYLLAIRPLNELKEVYDGDDAYPYRYSIEIDGVPFFALSEERLE